MSINPDTVDDRLRSTVGRIITNAFNWPDGVAHHLLGRDLSGPIDKLVEALGPVIAYAKAEELEAAADEAEMWSMAGAYFPEWEKRAEWLRARAATVKGGLTVDVCESFVNGRTFWLSCGTCGLDRSLHK